MTPLFCHIPWCRHGGRCRHRSSVISLGVESRDRPPSLRRVSKKRRRLVALSVPPALPYQQPSARACRFFHPVARAGLVLFGSADLSLDPDVFPFPTSGCA